MRIVIDGKIYDSVITPILIVFDDNEKDIFNMNRFVSAPNCTTAEERQRLIDTDINKLYIVGGSVK